MRNMGTAKETVIVVDGYSTGAEGHAGAGL